MYFTANVRNTVRNSPADMTLLSRNVATITFSFLSCYVGVLCYIFPSIHIFSFLLRSNKNRELIMKILNYISEHDCHNCACYRILNMTHVLIRLGRYKPIITVFERKCAEREVQRIYYSFSYSEVTLKTRGVWSTKGICLCVTIHPI
jgi:hypothetical protein